MGALQAKFSSDPKQEEMPSDFGDDSTTVSNEDLKNKSTILSME
jgi:hypothetical protein